MSRAHFSRFGGFFAQPRAVQAFAWSAPMRELATRIGISDVALRKNFHKLGITTPPQGYWNRAAAGRPLPAPPPIPPRRPGESGRVRLDERFRGHVAEAPSMPAGGPFASAAVPEDIEALRAQELKAIGRVAAARNLGSPAAGLAQLLRREEELRQKALSDRWAWRKPQFDTPLAQRQLKLLSALFKALAKRQHEGAAWESDGELQASCTIGDMHLSLQFAVIGKHRTDMIGGRLRPARDLPASTPLALSLARRFQNDIGLRWQDDAAGKLETKLAQIAADIITAGEAAFRQSLVEAAAAKERQRQRREEERLQRIAALEAKRIADLRSSGELLRQAEEIRVLVTQVRAVVVAGQNPDISREQLRKWEAWALAQADRLDPVRSGQVLEHLFVRELDEAEGDSDERKSI